MEDMELPFEEYIERIEESFAEWGICRIVPPKEWIPRAAGYGGLDDLLVPKPIRQHSSGTKGVYKSLHLEKKSMLLREFESLASKPENQPPPRCRGEDGRFDEHELERAFWKNLTHSPPLYGADGEGSLFDDHVKWNVANLDTMLSKKLTEAGLCIPGVNTSYLYIGTWRSMFAWHTEDVDLYSVNYLHFGENKSWYSIPPAHRSRFERFVRDLVPELYKQCPEFLRHKELMLSPQLLQRYSIPVTRLTQRPRDFVINYPGVYHAGFNQGFNCAESTNFATRRWVPIGAQARACTCSGESVRIDMSLFGVTVPPPVLRPLRPPKQQHDHGSLPLVKLKLGEKGGKKGPSQEQLQQLEKPQSPHTPRKKRLKRSPRSSSMAVGSFVSHSPTVFALPAESPSPERRGKVSLKRERKNMAAASEGEGGVREEDEGLVEGGPRVQKKPRSHISPAQVAAREGSTRQPSIRLLEVDGAENAHPGLGPANGVEGEEDDHGLGCGSGGGGKAQEGLEAQAGGRASLEISLPPWKVASRKRTPRGKRMHPFPPKSSVWASGAAEDGAELTARDRLTDGSEVRNGAGSAGAGEVGEVRSSSSSVQCCECKRWRRLPEEVEEETRKALVRGDDWFECAMVGRECYAEEEEEEVDEEDCLEGEEAEGQYQDPSRPQSTLSYNSEETISGVSEGGGEERRSAELASWTLKDKARRRRRTHRTRVRTTAAADPTGHAEVERRGPACLKEKISTQASPDIVFSDLRGTGRGSGECHGWSREVVRQQWQGGAPPTTVALSAGNGEAAVRSGGKRRLPGLGEREGRGAGKRVRMAPAYLRDFEAEQVVKRTGGSKRDGGGCGGSQPPKLIVRLKMAGGQYEVQRPEGGVEGGRGILSGRIDGAGSDGVLEGGGAAEADVSRGLVQKKGRGEEEGVSYEGGGARKVDPIGFGGGGERGNIAGLEEKKEWSLCGPGDEKEVVEEDDAKNAELGGGDEEEEEVDEVVDAAAASARECFQGEKGVSGAEGSLKLATGELATTQQWQGLGRMIGSWARLRF